LWNYGTWQAKLYAPLQMWRMRSVIRESRHTIYVTRRFLQDRYPTCGHAAVASNVEIARPGSDVLASRLLRMDQTRHRVVFGLIGSLQHRYKGLDTALQALGRVRDQLPDLTFKVLGPGDPRPWQARAAKYGLEHRVRFCGVLPSGEAVLAWLDDIDIYLQPSFQEGLPRALIEAMSRACPSIGSTAGGIPELLSADCLHRPGDAAFLGTLIVRAATDRAWRRTQAARNFQVAQNYTKDHLERTRAAFWATFARQVAPPR
jgi:glycosyltransferase involved in cell wall biosynthesis